MKNTLKKFGIIAITAVIVFSMAACVINLPDDPGNILGGVPAAPTGLTATAISSTDIFLTWNAVNGATGYAVYVSLSASSGYNKLGNVTSTSVTAPGGNSSTTYYFQVSAFNGNGEGPRSNPASATTWPSGGGGGGGGGTAVTGVTLSPSNLSLTVGQSAPLTATITPSSATIKNVNWTTSNANVAIVANGTVVGVSAGSATITVTTVDGSKTATCSVNVTGSTGTGTKPATPTNLKTVTDSPHSIRIDWTGNANATLYYVWRSETSSGNFTNRVGIVSSSNPASPDTPNAFTFTDTGLTHNKTYYYRVSAYNNNGESGQSSYVGGTTQNIVPTNLKTVVESPHSIRIDWTGNPDADEYYIWRSETSSGNYTTKVGTVYYFNPASPDKPNAFTFTDTGLAHNKTYYYRVSAYNSYGESAQSSYVGGTTQNIVPTGLKTTPLSSSSIKLEWTGNADATEYYIWRNTTSSGNFTTKVGTVYSSSSSTLSYSFTDTGLSADTPYYYRVSAYNSFGESAQSSYTSGRTQK